MSQAKRIINKARWPELSPLLDELLDLDLSARASRLMALHRQDPELAADLAELLARQAKQEAADYLATPLLGLAAHTLAAGQLVGAYTLVREIGHGGMGAVWLARRTDGRFEGEVAIKFLSAGLVGPGDAGRFAREGQILARLAHPHIARLLDAGLAAESKAPYLVLEYIAGQPIDQYCDSHGLDTRARVLLFRDVLAAVAHAHTRLILHRDLKPSNILVTANGEVKLLDFGIAKLLEASDEAGAAAGGSGAGSATSAGAASELTQQAGRAFTPRYAAPEQVQGSEVTTATDVYALGVLLYLLLSGRHPTATNENDANTTPLERMRGIVEVEPKKLSDAVRGKSAEGKAQDLSKKRAARELRGDLDTIVAKALKKVPAERYANAAALSEELRRWLAHEPISARPDSAYYRTAKFVRRHRWGVAAGAAATLSLAGLTSLSLAQAWRAERAEKIAQQRSADADDLLGYLLGDFADKLRPIGRLELLNDVGAKSLAHLRASPEAQASPHSILQRAKALTVLGEVAVSKHELDAAMDPLEAARKLLAGPPPDQGLAVEWRKAQGTASFWMGQVHFTKRQFRLARADWEDYRRSCEEWLATAPGEFDPLVELSYAENSLGSVLLESGDLSGAEAKFRKSIELKDQALKIKPLDQSLRGSWADSLSWLASTLSWQGRFKEALAFYEIGLNGIALARSRAPSDLKWAYNEAVMRGKSAQALRQLKQIDQAKEQLQFAARALADLLKHEPKNWRWQFQSVLVDFELTQVAPQSTLELELRQQLERLSALDQSASASARLRRLPVLVQITLALTRHLETHGRYEASIAPLVEVLESVSKGLSQQPTDLLLLTARAQTRLAMASLHGGMSHSDQRIEQCEMVVTELSGLKALLQVHYEITQAWVQAHSCLGRASDVQVEQDWVRHKLGS
nr:serine/threonine-protein kinase [uncultured Roseateles sp.]